MHKLIFTVFVVSVVPLAGQSPQDKLIGRWRSTEVSPAGVSNVFEFRADNQLDSSAALISDEKYRLIGTDTILLQSKNREEKQELEWDSQDRARIEDEAAGKSMELVRAGKISDAQNPLVGEWTTTRDWNGKTYPGRALFFSGGRVVWITIIRSEHGRYSVESKHIRLEIPNRPIVEGDLTITEDRLTLPNPKGGEFSFSRF